MLIDNFQFSIFLRPLLSFFAAQEIPAAVVTFVSLLIFIQTGTSPALSTCYSALLALPWILKPWLKRQLHNHYSYSHLLACELCLAATFLLLSAIISPSSPFRLHSSPGIFRSSLFILHFILALLTAWHVVLAEYYYHLQARSAKLRRLYSTPRLVVSQGVVVATYGLLIILVGSLQVLSHSIYVSWAAVFKILAGFMLLFFLWHLLPLFIYGRSWVMRRPASKAVRSRKSGNHLNFYRVPDRYLNRSGNVSRRQMLLLFLFLLPQSLMFYARVLYLLAPFGNGGLSRSIQEVGYAHGVVGALAFFLGLVLSRRMAKRHPNLGLLVLLSPFVYLGMTIFPPQWLWQICVCTFVAQFAFGYGLHSMLTRLGFFPMSGLRSPFVATAMLVPAALSGLLLQSMDFQTYFLVDVLTSVIALLAFFSPIRVASF